MTYTKSRVFTYKVWLVSGNLDYAPNWYIENDEHPWDWWLE